MDLYSGSVKATKLPPRGRPDFPPPRKSPRIAGRSPCKCWGGIAAERQFGLKQHFTGFLVEDSKGLVGGGPDEDQTARCHQGPP